jgi:hypothetical protein
MDDIIRQALHDFRAYRQRRHYAAHTLANYTLDPPHSPHQFPIA